jgi:hypothetical protein
VRPEYTASVRAVVRRRIFTHRTALALTPRGPQPDLTRTDIADVLGELAACVKPKPANFALPYIREVSTMQRSPGADVGRGEPSPGADVGRGEPSPGADVGRDAVGS